MNSRMSNIALPQYAFHTYPSAFLYEIVYQLLNKAEQVFMSIVFLQWTLNAMQLEKGFRHFAVFFCVAFLFMLMIAGYRSWYEKSGFRKMEAEWNRRLCRMVFEQAGRVELACYEDQEFYQNYTKAALGLRERVQAVTKDTASVIALLCQITYTVYVVARMDVFAILCIFPALFASFWIGVKLNAQNYELILKNTLPNRRKEYIERVAFDKKFAFEMRLFPVMDALLNRLHKSTKECMENIRSVGKQKALLDWLNNFFGLSVPMFAAFLYASYRLLVSHTILYGDFTVLALGILDLAFAVIAFIQLLSKRSEYANYYRDFRRFMDYEPQISQDQDGWIPLADQEFCLNQVSFAYPGQKEWTLEEVSFTVRPREIIAIVGRNGAGKSTLVKLLLRFYDPVKGTVEYGGKNIAEYSVKAYRQLFRTIFQDFGIFSISIRDNILMDQAAENRPDWISGTEESMREEPKQRVRDAVEKSGLGNVLKKLPEGLDTVVGRAYQENGTMLSGGEMQKLGIARALASEAPCVIMDEPSSALDPIAEAEMFERLREVCKGKTVFFVSHRLSAAQTADRILYMENGKILEEGSHSQLMAQAGKYAQMFRMQAKQYQDEADG